VITLPSSASLRSATDDGLPNPPATLTLQWSQVSGPGAATFANGNAASTTVSFSQAGIYVLRLSANDSLVGTADDVTLTVNPAPPVNQAPVVDAGPAQTITLPAGATLTGTVSDDGLPRPPGMTTAQWRDQRVAQRALPTPTQPTHGDILAVGHVCAAP
jgi:hypothetical protein